MHETKNSDDRGINILTRKIRAQLPVLNTVTAAAAILLGASLGTLPGCLGLTKTNSATQSGAAALTPAASTVSGLGKGSVSGLAAFQSSYYAFAQTNCVSCHGSAQSPMFAAADVNTAYANARNAAYIDFNHVSGSALAVYAGNGHCGTPNCQGKTAAATTALNTWAAAELAAAATPTGGTTPTATPTGGSGGTSTGTGGTVTLGYVSAPLAIPSPLPTPGATFTPMRWALSSFTPSAATVTGAANAILEIEIQQLSATNYRLRNPKLAGLTAPVELQGLHVMIKKSTDSGNGSEQPLATEWTAIDAVAATNALPNPLPKTPFTTAKALDANGMVLPVLSANDQISVGFVKLLPATATTVTASFASINTNIIKPACANCHGANNPDGGISLSSYTAVLSQLRTGNPEGSQLYISISGNKPSMPPSQGTPVSAAGVTAIYNWIAAGAPNN